MKSFFSSLFLISLLACTPARKTEHKETAPDYSKLTIIYKCGACFGRCPIYTLTISGANLTAKFQGDKNTPKLGIYSKKISNEEITKMVAAFETAKFSSLDDEYLGNIADFPIKYITYTNNGTTKTIKERSGAPEHLLSLEKLLKAVAENEEGWVKESGE